MKHMAQRLRLPAIIFFAASFFMPLFVSSTYAAPQKLPPRVLKQARFEISKTSAQNIVILIPKNHSKPELDAAKLLHKYLALYSENLKIEIRVDAQQKIGEKIIFISKNPNARPVSPRLDDFSNTVSNSIAASVDRVDITYCLSPQNAVGDFLRSLGFKFYTPGELGTIVPAGSLRLNAGRKTYSPHFLHVSIFGLEDADWYHLNGLKSSLPGFSHNLLNIFDEKAFAKHPEFRPQLAEFQNPKYAQPNFMERGASNFAAKKALDFFEKNPERTAFSVGINDSLIFDKRTPQTPEPLAFFRNYPNYSDAYFTFAAAVARLVAKKEPDKFIGCLAYLSTESVPNFRLPQNLYPMLTSDRASNFNEEKRAEDLNLIKRWANSGVKIAGIYDYLAGSPYIVPRNVEDFAWKGILHAKNAGVRAYFAEAYPDWPYDGAKLWVTAQLLNGASESPQELENSFYKDMYPRSHKAVMSFIEESKSAWKNRTDTPYWISFYKRDAVAELFPKQRIAKMEDALKRAEAMPTDTLEKRRIFQLRLSFETTKAFCNYYFAQKNIFRLADNSGVTDMLDALQAARYTDKDFADKRELRNALKAYATPQNSYKPEFTPPTDSIALECFKRASADEKSRLQNILGAKEFEKISIASQPRATIFSTGFNYPDFVSQTAGVKKFPSVFRTKVVPNEHSDFRLMKSQNGNCVQIKNCTYAELVKFEKIREGKICAFKFNAHSRISISTTAYASLLLLDKNSTVIARRTVSIPPMNEAQIRDFEIILNVPPETKFAATAVIVWNMHNPDDFLQINSMSLEADAAQ